MKKVSQKLIKLRELILAVIDTLSICLAYWFAYYIRMDYGSLYSYETYRAVFHHLHWVVLINLVFLFVFKLNRTLWQYVSIDEVVRVCAAILCTNVTWLCVVMLTKIPSYPKSVPMIAALLQVFFMLGVRILYRFYRRSQMQSNRSHRAVIIGAGSAGAIAQKDLMMNDRYDTKVVGFVDDAPLKQGKIIAGLSVLGTTDDLALIKEKYNVDSVYIAIKHISQGELKQLIMKCRDAGLKTQILSIEMRKGDQSVAKIRDVSIDDLLGRGEIKLDNAGIGSYLTNKVIMVTGAGGSIGSELVRQIIQFKPKQLVLVDIYENGMYDLQMELRMKQRNHIVDENVVVTCLIGSVREKDRIHSIMQTYQPNVVFHAAAHKHVPLVEDSPSEAIKNNVFGTLNVVQCAIANKVEKFVLISTDKAVNPTNVMGATKRMCELIIQGYRNNGITELCAVRFGNVLGSNGSVIPLFKRQIAAGGPVTVTHPDIIRYFMTIPEAARLVLQAGVYGKQGEIFILDMGSPVKILDLAENLIKLSGLVPYEDIDIQFTGLRPGEKMYEELLYEKDDYGKTENDLIYVSYASGLAQAEIDKKLERLHEAVDNKQNVHDEIMKVIH